MSTSDRPTRGRALGKDVPAGAEADVSTSPPAQEAAQRSGRRGRSGGQAAAGGNMLPGRQRRRLGVERLLVRLIATGGIVGIGVALGAILTSNKVEGWIIGLVIAVVSIVLSAMLWSSRQL